MTPTGRPHIVDTLIAERAPRLCASPLWPLARPPLYALLGYGKARRMADAIAPMAGRAAMDYVSALLKVKVSVRGLEHLPAAGRLVAVANHPTGIADGIAGYDAIKSVRPNLVCYPNLEPPRGCPGFDEALIPVEWVEAKRTRDRTRITLQMTRQALENEQALVIFPAGRLATRVDGQLTDPPWQSSALSIARKYEAPVVPVHVSGPWSTLFHLFDGRSQELRDITLFHELLNKTGRAFSLIIGRPIPAAALDADPAVATEQVKHFVERVLPLDPDAVPA